MKKLVKSKKGDVPFIVIAMMIGVFFFVVWLLISGKITGGFSEEVSKRAVEQKLDSCKLKYEKSSSDGVVIADKDQDGLPDSCDNCPTVPNSGEIVEDKDGDNFPVFKDTKKNINICCGNNGLGDDDPKLDKKYCETPENDRIYGPGKLFTSYIIPKKA